MQLLPPLTRDPKVVAREKPVGAHLPYARHVNTHTLETCDGLLCQVIHLRGLLFETADSDELNYRKRLRDAMLQAIGSPISPVLTALVHRSMFDAIKRICDAHELQMSLWVDDLAISGRAIRGTIIDAIRAEMRKCGFQTHKIQFRNGNRPVIITGIPIDDGRVAAPRSVHERIRVGYAALPGQLQDAERAHEIDRLLSALGTLRYHAGKSSAEGRLAANRMNALRQRRAKLTIIVTTGGVMRRPCLQWQ